MPTKKKIFDSINGKPFPDIVIEPEQFFFQDDNLTISQFSFESPPTITTIRVQLLQDIQKIEKWKNECNLPGRREDWCDVITQSFREILKYDVEKQSTLYSKYRESLQAKLIESIKRLKKVHKEGEIFLNKMTENIVACIVPFAKDFKLELEYIKKQITIYENIKNDIISTKSGYYSFIKPFIEKLKLRLEQSGISKDRDQQRIILNLFKVFNYSDFNSHADENGLERIRSSFF